MGVLWMQRVRTTSGKWIGALICGALLAPQIGAAAEVRLRCTNPYSGAQWYIQIDYERRTVDSFPAQITPTQIKWHDSVGRGYYELDRGSGALTVVFASSTGGYALHDTCGPG
jgi:hypothetical protein